MNRLQEVEELAWLVDDQVSWRQLIYRKAPKPKAVAGDAAPCRRRARRAPIDDGITHHKSLRRQHGCGFNQRPKRGRIRLAGEWTIAADDAPFERRREVETFENRACGRKGLVCEHGKPD